MAGKKAKVEIDLVKGKIAIEGSEEFVEDNLDIVFEFAEMYYECCEECDCWEEEYEEDEDEEDEEDEE